MTRLEDRQTLVHLVTETRVNGGRQAPACALAGSIRAPSNAGGRPMV
jgi:hypothetical protein